MRIRSYLLLMSAAVLVPGFLAATIALEQVGEGEREAALRGLRETVRASALAVDGEVHRSLGALTALGQSAHLRSGDLASFYEEARAIDLPPDVWTLLFDETGTQVLNTAVPFGTAPPPPAAGSRAVEVLKTGKPLVTDVFLGPATGKLLTTVYVPAAAVGKRRYVVAQAFAIDHWTKKVTLPPGREGWILGVIDRGGRFITRTLRTAEVRRQPARPELVAAASAANEGMIRHHTLEGVDAYDAFAHSALTGWTVAVAAPVRAIEASTIDAIAWLAAGVAGALTVALSAALLLGRVLYRDIAVASQAARALGRGRTPVTARTSIREIQALNDALADAGRLLGEERASRTQAEAERGRLLAAETAARAAAQQQNAAKDEFLALLGHELRNPLAAISGATAMIARKGLDGSGPDRLLAIVQRQSRHLGHIVDDLLDVSRLMSGRIALDREVIELGECVASCVEGLRTGERAAGYRFSVEVDTVWVEGDAVRIEQIVNNLVSNSLKYSADGSAIVVRVRAEPEQALIEVSDEGVGISAELMPRIFEPFVQGPAFPGRAPNGLGIGLALVRQLVTLHGGEVAARAGPDGQGSTFVVSLPRVPPPVHQAQPDMPAAITACRVLLVEDNADARETMAELLRMMGYEVDEAGDGAAAIAAVVTQPPDVIVMDIGLPGRDGYQIAADLRARAGLADLPMIALTGYGQARDRTNATTAGFDDHLVKPIDPDALSRAIEQQLGRRARAAS